jgi:CheY-like chemotaxis protein
MPHSRAHVLVVDDERNIRKHLTIALEALGYTVDATSDGEEALAKCSQRPYDIAFVDIQTPKIGDLEVRTSA